MIEECMCDIYEFNAERDWLRQKTNEQLLLLLQCELGELTELFILDREYPQEDIEDEVADVFAYLLMFCIQNGIDLKQAFTNKMKKNEAKYPVDKFRGSNKKYTDL